MSAAEPRRIFILRHGETTHNAQNIWQGQLDSPLNEVGIAQARAAAEALRQAGLSRVVASDLKRAAVTGRTVAEACDVPISYDERLREIHAGVWQGMSGSDVREQYPDEQERLGRGEDFVRGESGESVADVAARTKAALADVVAAMAPGEAVLIATHGVAGRAAAAELVGLDQGLAWTVLAGLGNCHWAELSEGRLSGRGSAGLSPGWRIQTWNMTA